MARSDRSPSIVPPGDERDVYLVLDDFGGRIGQAWREIGVEDTDLETVITELLEGQYSSPVRVIGFNTAEGWSRDVSADVAQMLRQRCAEEARDLPSCLEEFVDRYLEMTTVAKLLARKQQLLERLEEGPGPHERGQIKRFLAEIDSALDSVEEAGPGETRDGQQAR